VSDRFDSIEESERVWLDEKRRSAARRSWLLIGALVLVAVFLAWLTVDGLGGGQAVTTTTTVDQRALADGQQALTDWGRFAVTCASSRTPSGPTARSTSCSPRRRSRATSRSGRPPTR